MHLSSIRRKNAGKTSLPNDPYPFFHPYIQWIHHPLYTKIRSIMLATLLLGWNQIKLLQLSRKTYMIKSTQNTPDVSSKVFFTNTKISPCYHIIYPGTLIININHKENILKYTPLPTHTKKPRIREKEYFLLIWLLMHMQTQKYILLLIFKAISHPTLIDSSRPCT